MERESKSLSQVEHSACQLKHYQRIRAECWSSESSEVREEVLKIYDAEHKGDEEDSEENEEDGAEEDEDEKSLLERQQEWGHFKCGYLNNVLIHSLTDASK